MEGNVGSYQCATGGDENVLYLCHYQNPGHDVVPQCWKTLP